MAAHRPHTRAGEAGERGCARDARVARRCARTAAGGCMLLTLGAAAPTRVPARARHGAWIARCAIASLHAELALFPKPGLVSLEDRGAHDDMDAALFMRSVFALRNAFRDA